MPTKPPRASRVLVRVLGLSALVAAGPLTAQDAPGTRLIVNAAELRFGGRVQTQFNTTSGEGVPDSELFLRRVRLGAEVKINELVSGEIEAEFAGDRISLKDAYLLLTFSPGLQVLTGQESRPFSLLEQTSSRRILPIERGAAIRGVDALDQSELVAGLDYADRDVGIQFMGAPAGAPLDLEYAAGVFRGPLHGEVGPRDSYQYAARLSVAPLGRARLGAGWSSRHFAHERSGDFGLKRGNAWEIDLEYGSFDPGIHVAGEVAVGDFDPFADMKFFGAQAWLGYRTQPLSILSAVEPIFRASHGAVNDGAPEARGHGGTLLTPGLNLYFGGWNRLMVNYDVWLPNGDGGVDGSFKAQLQMVF